MVVTAGQSQPVVDHSVYCFSVTLEIKYVAGLVPINNLLSISVALIARF